MNSERWERLQSLFHAATNLPDAERRVFLEAESKGDTSMVTHVLAMLDEDARTGSALDRGLAEVAHDVLRSGDSDRSLPTQEFGAYRVTSVLGEGGMGVVYLAERKDLGSKAAIKILRDAWLSPARRERFMAEQRTLAQLTHPSIARLYDCGALPDGTPWFVMEYVEGTPVTAYCREHSCTVAERLALFREICEAVQFAHSHLIIHRDLKPSNILVCADGSVKLLDFGISKQLDSLDSPSEQTRTAMRLMTPAYAAPEQIRGDRVGLHTDVYSLGVVLYELLVGRLPFDLSSHSPGEAERILLEREPEKPSTAARRMPNVSGDTSHFRTADRSAWADLDVLCLTAMHKDAERRYRTVDALLRDVDHFLKQEPLEARGDSATYRLGKFVKRNRPPIVAGATVVAGVVLLTGFYTVRLRDARNDALAQAGRAERIQQLTLNILQGGDEAAGPSDSIRVVTLIDRGVQEARALTGEPATQAQLFETLGSTYHKLGRLGSADSVLRESLARREALFGKDHSEVAKSLIALGLVYSAKAEYDSAKSYVKRGLEMSRRHLPPEHPAIGKATASLGQVLDESGEYDEAIVVLNEGVAMQSRSGKVTVELALNMTELGNAHFYAGNYAQADSIFRRVVTMDRGLYGPRHPTVADDLINLGAIQFEFGNYKESERLYREALEIIRPWYGNNHPATAANLTMLGRVLVSQKKLDEGAKELGEAVRINERAFGPDHPRVASALNELGRVAQQQGRLDQAEADFRRMAQIYRTVHKDKHYVIGVALSNLAGVLNDKKQYAQAESIFRDVLRRYAEVLAPDHQLVGIARVRLGQTLLLEKNYAAAERELLDGYGILAKQSSPPPVWVERARLALVATYDLLRKPQSGQKYREELAKAARETVQIAAKK